MLFAEQSCASPCRGWSEEGPPLTRCDDQCVDLQVDSSNCGECGNVCEPAVAGMAAWCYFGECKSDWPPVELAATTHVPEGLAVDATYVYWTTGCGGLVQRVSKNGGAIETLVSAQPGARSIAVDATHVYWAITCEVWRAAWESRCCSAPSATVLRAPLGGGPVEVLAGALPSDIRLVVLDDASVYFSTRRDGIWRVPKAGGTPVPLAPAGSFGSLAVGADGYLYAAGEVPAPANDADTKLDVYRVPVGGGTLDRLTNGWSVQSLAVDDTSVYWIDYIGSGPEFSEVIRVGKTGFGTSLITSLHERLLPEYQRREEQSIIVDGGSLYWNVYGDPYRVAKAGGDATYLIVTPSYDSGGNVLAVDETSVYFPLKQHVMKVPK
jgi:hypothetical protein